MLSVSLTPKVSLFQLGDVVAERGGENYLLDAPSLLASLPPEMLPWLDELEMEMRQPLRELEPAERDEDGPGLWRSPLCRDGAAPPRPGDPARPPYFRCPTGGGYQIHEYGDAPAASLGPEDTARAASLLEAIHHSILHADNGAPRFVIGRGQALIVDNLRMLHARERFEGARIVRRVWFWTDRHAYANR